MSLIFFVVSAVQLSVPGFYNSPDETANAVFIRMVAEQGEMRYLPRDDYGALTQFVHPRSTFVKGRDTPVRVLGAVAPSTDMRER